MMKYLLIALSFACILACKSAKDKYEDKNYSGAFDEALSNLNKKKDSRENLTILKKSLKQLVVKYNQTYDRLYTAVQPEDKIPLVDANIDLVNKLDKADQYIVADTFYNYKKLTADNVKWRNELGNHFKISGIELLDKSIDTGKKSFAQEAYTLLIQSEKYYGIQNELSRLKEEALKYGTVVSNVKVEHWISDFSSFDVDRQFQRIESTSGKFYKLYYNKNLKRSELDCELELEIESINFRETSQTRSQTFTEKVLDRYDIVVDENGNKKEIPVYKNISGTVNIITSTLRADTDINLIVNKVTQDCPIRNNSWSRYVETQGEEYRLSGDLKAIPDAYKTNSMANMKSKSRLSEELLEELFNAVRYELD